MRLFGVICLIVFLTGCGGERSDKGDEFFKHNDFKEAIAEYDKKLETDPSNATALYNRGRAHEELGNLDQAEQDFLKVLEADEKNVKALLSLSKLYYGKEAYNKAVIFADKALAVNENTAQGHFLLARAKHQLGYVDSALESYGLAIKINRDFGEAYLYRGAIKVHKNQMKSACEDFRKAVNLDVAEARPILKKYCQ